MSSDYNLSHLDELEAEGIYVLREVAAQFDRPAILFSGGKDSICVTHLAAKAFAPAPHPHAIGSHRHGPQLSRRRFSSVTTWSRALGVQLIVGSVQDLIDRGEVAEETGFNASRNQHPNAHADFHH